ncbi:MAG: multiple sugar transport system permease protein [Gammaproteobacteria bacterium]|jgi:multiple sugar transport system permease protein
MQRSSTSFWFVAPAVVLMILLLIIPIVVAATLSFTDYNLGSPDFNWIGFKNYESLAKYSSYKKMFTASLLYVVIVVPVSVVLGLGSAMLISSIRFGGEAYKAVFFLPVMATLLAMAIVWEFTLDPIVGVVNSYLTRGCEVSGWYQFITGAWLGFDPANSWYGYGCTEGFPLWIGDKRYALGSIAFIGIWQAFGFNMVLYLAGLTAVPRELYAAAAMDGADSAWERFKLVTWPMLGPTHVFVITITSIRSFQVFDTVEALTAGGPSKSTYVMIYAMYEKGIKQNLIGMGSTITVVFLLFVLAITLFQVYFVNRRVHYS